MNKSIEERALEYAPEYQYDSDITMPNYELSDIKRESFMYGAKSEREELLKWNNPEEVLPEKDKNVLVKYVSLYDVNNDVNTYYYTVGTLYGNNQWDCESKCPNYQNFKIIGWREIFE